MKLCKLISSTSNHVLSLIQVKEEPHPFPRALSSMPGDVIEL